MKILINFAAFGSNNCINSMWYWAEKCPYFLIWNLSTLLLLGSNPLADSVVFVGVILPSVPVTIVQLNWDWDFVQTRILNVEHLNHKKPFHCPVLSDKKHQHICVPVYLSFNNFLQRSIWCKQTTLCVHHQILPFSGTTLVNYFD